MNERTFIKVNNINFIITVAGTEILFRREKCEYSIYESEIKSGKAYTYSYEKELTDHLDSYKLALNKFKKLKAFL